MTSEKEDLSSKSPVFESEAEDDGLPVIGVYVGLTKAEFKFGVGLRVPNAELLLS